MDKNNPPIIKITLYTLMFILIMLTFLSLSLNGIRNICIENDKTVLSDIINSYTDSVKNDSTFINSGLDSNLKSSLSPADTITTIVKRTSLSKGNSVSVKVSVHRNYSFPFMSYDYNIEKRMPIDDSATALLKKNEEMFRTGHAVGIVDGGGDYSNVITSTDKSGYVGERNGGVYGSYYSNGPGEGTPYSTSSNSQSGTVYYKDEKGNYVPISGMTYNPNSNIQLIRSDSFNYEGDGGESTIPLQEAMKVSN